MQKDLSPASQIFSSTLSQTPVTWRDAATTQRPAEKKWLKGQTSLQQRSYDASFKIKVISVWITSQLFPPKGQTQRELPANRALL